jgi:hypothetical protein
MKKAFLISGIILSFIAGGTSAQNFFPLSIGNMYQIKNDWSISLPGNTWETGTIFKKVYILDDTLINGTWFYSITNGGAGSPYPGYLLYYYDSQNQKVFVLIPGDNSVHLAVDFNIPADSQYTSYITGEPKEFISQGVSSEYVLNDTVLVYKMETPWTSSIIDHYDFANNIGLTYFRHLEIIPPAYGFDYKYYTVSACVDSTIFNPLVLKIDSLYPVIDRPIDTFPFLLSIPFHVSYSQLVNAFYLTLEVVRDTSVIFNLNYNISLSNPHIQINPSNLQIGDIIKLKATISDTSIFNNIDIYPDSGWVTFRVLDPVSVNDDNKLGYEYKLGQNYPNPFNPNTIISYEIPERTFVSLKIYDILGKEVADLVNKELPAGDYEAEFKAGRLSSGVYIYQLRTAGFVQTMKMILSK